MNRKTINAGAALLAACIAAPAALANVLSLAPLATIEAPGGRVMLEIRMDFLQETVGGAFDLLYDADVLAFEGFEYDSVFASVIADPAFLLTPDNCIADGSAQGGCSPGDEEINALGFGNFDGIIGSYVIGRITFLALQPGVAVVELAATDSPFGGFSDTLGEEMTVAYNGAKVIVTPLPGALWMLLGALGVLAPLRR